MNPIFNAKLAAILLAGLIFLTGTGARPLAVNTPGSIYEVNSPLDSPDADLADGLCRALNGLCTLRAAIMQSNFSGGNPTIQVPAGVYLLTRVGYDDAGLVGDLDITAQVSIQGAGEGLTIIDGNGAVTADRVFHILPGATAVNLTAMTIRNGSLPGSANGSYGGGILTYSLLILNHILLEGNSALMGGGLYVSFCVTEIQNTVIRNNVSVPGGAGGGILSISSQLNLHDTQVYGNTADSGGGVALLGSLPSLFERSEIYSNSAAGLGGGISYTNLPNVQSYALTLLESSLHNNSAGASGGGISTTSALTLTRTTVDANHAALNGGGVYAVGGFPLAFEQSTLSHNTAQYGGGLSYEGSQNPIPILTMVNTTLSANSVSGDGAGIYALNNAKISLYNVTIAANVLSRGHGQIGLLRGGGLFFIDTSVITAQNTLIADNYYTNNLTTITPDDCYNTQVTNSLNSLGSNLIETTSNCLMVGNTSSDVTGQDPKLGPLGYHLGLTQTQVPLPGSPAIDAAQEPPLLVPSFEPPPC